MCPPPSRPPRTAVVRRRSGRSLVRVYSPERWRGQGCLAAVAPSCRRGSLVRVGTMTVPVHTLNDGRTIPAIGFGTYPLRGDAGRDAVVSALEVGYRLLDTAVNYRNEREVGEALRASG